MNRTKVNYKTTARGTEKLKVTGGRKAAEINVNHNHDVGNGIITTCVIMAMAPVVKDVAHAGCHVVMRTFDGVANTIGNIINSPKKKSKVSKQMMEAEEE